MPNRDRMGVEVGHEVGDGAGVGSQGLLEAQVARLLAEFTLGQQLQLSFGRGVEIRAGRDILGGVDNQVGVYQPAAVIGAHWRSGGGQQRFQLPGRHRLAGEAAGGAALGDGDAKGR